MSEFERRPAPGPAEVCRQDGAGPPARSRRLGDDGFLLLETIVTVSLITIIMTALASFFLNAIDSTNQQRARQTATQVATSAVEKIHGLPASDLVNKRDAAAVNSQFDPAQVPPQVQPWLSSMDPAKDAEAGPGSGAGAAIPTTVVNQTVNNVVYGVSSYLGWCGVAEPSKECNLAGLTGGVTYLRAVVAISWRGDNCPASNCTYITATLVSTADDPTFNLYQVPTPTPQIVDPGDQNRVIGEEVNLQLAVKPNTGVPPFKWELIAGPLPTGLSFYPPGGLIAGTPNALGADQPVTVRVTDAFTRSTVLTFKWTIVPPLVIDPVGTQANFTESSINALTLSASGGAGAPYTWSDPGGTLPPNLVLETVNQQGRVTGTTSDVAKTYAVELTVKDKVGRTKTVSFNWTISYPPLVAPTPAARRSTLSTEISPFQLTSTGGSKSVVWSGGASLPAGLSLTNGGLVTGTPTALGSSAVQLKVTDAAANEEKTVSFTWTVVPAPTLSAPGNQLSRTGSTISVATATTCPNTPCTYTLSNGPATLNVTSTGVITGTITSGNQVFSNVSVMVQDSVGATATSSTFSWTITTYNAAVNSTAGLLSYWRLGEAAAPLTATDSFNGTAGSNLTSRAAEVGGTWAALSDNSSLEKISTGGRAYRSGQGYSVNYLPTTVSSLNYSVEADLFVRSNMAGEKIGVIARLNTGGFYPAYYFANWEQADGSWNLGRVSNNQLTYLPFVSGRPAMAANQTHRLRLTVTGTGASTTLSLFVNGVLTVGPVTDSTSGLQAAGRGGVMDGNVTAPADGIVKSDTTGLHYENFQINVATYPRAVDSKGSNTGDYKNGGVRGTTGALTDDANTAAQFDGVNDYVQATGTTGLPVGASNRSVELWIKTTESTKRQMLFDYGSMAQNARFALWLEPSGKAMEAWGWGGGADRAFTLPKPVNDGAWHHIVKTYDGTSLRLYIDGVALPAQAAVRATVMDQFGFVIGAKLNTTDTGSNGMFNGAIDEVSFYTTALSQATVTGHYQLGVPAGVDTSGPTGGSVDATGLVGTGARYAPSTTLNLNFTPGTDPDGLDPNGAQLLRATATLTSTGGTANGACGTYSSFTLVTGGNNPVSPKTDAVTDQACYRYQYVVADVIGNSTTYTSPDIKVDRTSPDAPTSAYSAGTNASWSPGLKGEYFKMSAPNARDFVAPGVQRLERNINFTDLVPTFQSLLGGQYEHTSARWTGQLQVPTTGAYTFYAIGDNGFRLYVNGQTTIDHWESDWDVEQTSTQVTLTAGVRYEFKLELFQDFGGANMFLRWAGPGIAKTIVPESAFTQPGASEVFIRSAAASGSFTTTAAATDPASGIASYTFPALGTNWTATPGALGVTTYSWTGAPAVPGTKTLTATNNAGLASAPAPFTVTADNTAPTAGTVTYPNGTTSSSSVNVSFTTGTDAGSGINSRLLQRRTAPLSGTTCGTFGAFATVANGINPTSPLANPITAGNCYNYQYVVSDYVGNVHTATSANVVKATVTYSAAVAATPGLLSYWRLGETAATLISSDSFTGAAATPLTSRTGELGATWAYQAGSTTERISSENRARRNGTGYSINYVTATPPSTNYSVEADIYVKGALADDAGGVFGRLNTTNTSMYMARREADNTWNIVKWANNAPNWLATSAVTPALTVGQTYRVKLDISGTTTTSLVLSVNGTVLLSATDTTNPYTLVGKAGIMDGETGGAASKSDIAGMHFDNFQVTPPTYPRAADSKGSNTGDYKNGVTLGAAGALAGDTNTATLLDGLNDYVQISPTTGLPTGAAPRSVELWFKTSGSTRQMLFDYGGLAPNAKFGLWLDAGGTTLTAWGWGGGNDKVFTLPAAVNNGAWHHVVKTYNGTSITLYVDGVALPPQAATRATTVDVFGFSIGAALNTLDQNSAVDLNGTIDDVSFYTTALSAADVTNHYQLGAP